MNLEILTKSLKDAPIIKKGNYSYIIHPITDGVPQINPELLEEVVNEMKKRIEKCGRIDKIVTMEAMGIPLATALSLKMRIPLVIIRKRSYGLPGEYVINQKTGYSKSKLYINDLKKDDNVVIVDDVLSTGGTIFAVLTAFEKIGVITKDIFIAVNKGNIDKKIMKEFNVNIDILVNIDVVDGKVKIKNI